MIKLSRKILAMIFGIPIFGFLYIIAKTTSWIFYDDENEFHYMTESIKASFLCILKGKPL